MKRREDLPYGPRASVETVGVCEPLPDGRWWLSGWIFNGRHDQRLLHKGCMYVHDDEDNHVGVLGWLFTELKEFSDASMALSMLEAEDRPPL